MIWKQQLRTLQQVPLNPSKKVRYAIEFIQKSSRKNELYSFDRNIRSHSHTLILAIEEAIEACKSDLESKHKDEVEKVKTDYDQEMGALRTSHEEMVQSLVSECETLRKKWSDEKLELANRFELKVNELEEVNMIDNIHLKSQH